MKKWIALAMVFQAMSLVAAAPPKEALTPEFLSTLAFDQKPGAVVPLDMILRDATGAPVRLGNLLKGKPAVLVLADYECIHLCSVVLNATFESVRQLRLTAGKDYEIIVVSIRPEELPTTARDRQHTYSTRYGRGEQGWHFLVQGKMPVRQLADAVGFRYAYDTITRQFAHPSGIMVLTPDGRVSRYLQGIEYKAQDLQQALTEAGRSRIGPIAQRLLLLCFHYDPTTGKYGLIITRVVQIAGLGTVAVLAAMIGFLKHREKMRGAVS
jgi:protein SCO1/2